MWRPLAAAAPQQQADGPGTTYAHSMAVAGVHVPLSMAVSSLSWAQPAHGKGWRRQASSSRLQQHLAATPTGTASEAQSVCVTAERVDCGQ